MPGKLLLILFAFLLLVFQAEAQKKKAVFRDTLDHRFDMSNYVVNLKGFVPYPTIISEPALGSFGVAFAAIFLSPKKTAGAKEQYRFPDITGVAGMYTLNNSWMAGALRQGSFPKIGLRYTVAAGYADINMDFYRTFDRVGEKKFSFELKPVFAMLDLSENLWKYHYFAGLKYTFIHMDARYGSKDLPDSVFDPGNFKTNLGTGGVYAELDFRNSIFTPDRGVRLKGTYTFGRTWTGSDVDIDKGEVYVNAFIPLWKWWICGIRSTWQMVNDDVPFYYFPFLDMRGLPIMKYQGRQTLLFETEQRFDITPRWSLVGFVGTGGTWSDSKFMQSDKWVVAGGTGFRYLVARLFRLRMGVDVAASPGQFAYYIVFGHYWNR